MIHVISYRIEPRRYGWMAYILVDGVTVEKQQFFVREVAESWARQEVERREQAVR